MKGVEWGKNEDFWDNCVAECKKILMFFYEGFQLDLSVPCRCKQQELILLVACFCFVFDSLSEGVHDKNGQAVSIIRK